MIRTLYVLCGAALLSGCLSVTAPKEDENVERLSPAQLESLNRTTQSIGRTLSAIQLTQISDKEELVGQVVDEPARKMAAALKDCTKEYREPPPKQSPPFDSALVASAQGQLCPVEFLLTRRDQGAINSGKVQTFSQTQLAFETKTWATEYAKLNDIVSAYGAGNQKMSATPERKVSEGSGRYDFKFLSRENGEIELVIEIALNFDGSSTKNFEQTVLKLKFPDQFDVVAKKEWGTFQSKARFRYTINNEEVTKPAWEAIFAPILDTYLPEGNF